MTPLSSTSTVSFFRLPLSDPRRTHIKCLSNKKLQRRLLDLGLDDAPPNYPKQEASLEKQRDRKIVPFKAEYSSLLLQQRSKTQTGLFTMASWLEYRVPLASASSHDAIRLDIKITFKLLQHYLIHIFRGERKELMKYLETEENTELFMLDFAAFYWSERIHLLQCINIIVTHCGNKKHPLSGCYTDLIEKMPDDILELMFSQLTSALNVFTPTLLTHGELMVPAQQQQWYQNYLHELMQIINNLFFCLKGYQTSSLNLLKTLQLCMMPDSDYRKSYFAFLKKRTAFRCYDSDYLLSNSDALDEVNRIVSAMDQRGAHGVIVMGWAFIKNIIADDDEQKTLAESNLENLYGNFDDVCSFLSQLLSNPIFQWRNLVQSRMWRQLAKGTTLQGQGYSGSWPKALSYKDKDTAAVCRRVLRPLALSSKSLNLFCAVVGGRVKGTDQSILPCQQEQMDHENHGWR
uniref:Uncharacterized protein n=1 Tax=Timema cristinae TaxID=61476 RepID=A0A7R9CA25_TIMCR|nr:unnamed protein product [Timema cristinae]